MRTPPTVLGARTISNLCLMICRRVLNGFLRDVVPGQCAERLLLHIILRSPFGRRP